MRYERYVKSGMALLMAVALTLSTAPNTVYAAEPASTASADTSQSANTSQSADAGNSGVPDTQTAGGGAADNASDNTAGDNAQSQPSASGTETNGSETSNAEPGNGAENGAEDASNGDADGEGEEDEETADDVEPETTDEEPEEAGEPEIPSITGTVAPMADEQADAIRVMIGEKEDERLLQTLDVTAPEETVFPAKITFDANVTAGMRVVLYHYVEESEEENKWERIEPETVGDGFITATFNSLSPVAVVSLIDTEDRYATVVSREEMIELTKSQEAGKALIVMSSEEIEDFKGAKEKYKYDVTYLLVYETEEECVIAYNDFLFAGYTVDHVMPIEHDEDNNEAIEQAKQDLVDKDETPETVETQNEDTSQEEVTANETIIAVIDTGVNKDDPMLVGRLVDGLPEDMSDENGHGTIISEIIASQTDETVKILPIKAFDENGKSNIVTVYYAILDAIDKGADAINLSISGVGESKMLTSVISYASGLNIPVIVAAGNEGEDVLSHMPGNIPDAITVSSVDMTEKTTEEKDALEPITEEMAATLNYKEAILREYNINRAPYSNFGDTIDFSAIGTITKDNGTEDTSDDIMKAGTSISAAYVTSYVGIILSNNPEADVPANLLASAVDFGDESWDGIYGNGFLTKENIVYNLLSDGRKLEKNLELVDEEEGELNVAEFTGIKKPSVGVMGDACTIGTIPVVQDGYPNYPIYTAANIGDDTTHEIGDINPGWSTAATFTYLNGPYSPSGSNSNYVFHIGAMADTPVTPGVTPAGMMEIWESNFSVTIKNNDEFTQPFVYTGADGHEYYHSGCDSDVRWVHFKDCVFRNVYFEFHFPVFFENCEFYNCHVDSRGSKDIVMYNCHFFGGSGTGYASGSTNLNGAIYTSGGSNIHLSKTECCETADNKLTTATSSLIYANGSNLYLYDNGTYIHNYDSRSDLYTITATDTGSVTIYGGDYRNNGSGGLLDVIRCDNVYLYGGNIEGYSNAVRNTSGTVTQASTTIVGVTYPGSDIYGNYNGIYNIGGTVNMSAGHNRDNTNIGIYQSGGTTNISGGIVSGNVNGVENQAGIVNMSGGELKENSYSGIFNSGELNLSAAGIQNNRYGVYQNGIMNMWGDGRVEYGTENSNNEIFLVKNHIINIPQATNYTGDKEWGQIYLRADDREIGRVLFTVYDNNAVAYANRIELRPEIQAHDSTDTETPDHLALVRGGNSVNAALEEGILSGRYRSLYTTNLTVNQKSLFDTKVFYEVDKALNTEAFIWKEGDSFDTATTAPTSEDMYIAKAYYKGTDNEVPYMKFVGWSLSANADPNNLHPVLADGVTPDVNRWVYTPSESKAWREAAALYKNFPWYAVWNNGITVHFVGNGNLDKDGNPMIDPLKVPAGAVIDSDNRGFTISKMDPTGVLPEYAFDKQVFHSAESHDYYDRNKEEYVDHVTEYSQQGWTFIPNAKYPDGTDVIYNSPDKYAGKNDVLNPSGESLISSTHTTPKYSSYEEFLDDAIANGWAVVTDKGVELTMYALYDEAPDIQAYDRYYTSDEIKSMTKEEFIEELLRYADDPSDPEGIQYIFATDKEDGDYISDPSVDRIVVEIVDDIDYDYFDYKEIGDYSDNTSPDIGGISVTYVAIDVVGNRSYTTAMVYVTSSHDTRSKDRRHSALEGSLEGYVAGREQSMYIRFIDEWNYKKNPYWDRALFEGDNNYTDGEFAVAWRAHMAGADEPYSKWYTEPELVREITDGFETLRTADSFADYESSYTFTRQDILDVQGYIEAHGIGKTKELDALSNFISILNGHRTASDMTVNNDGLAFQQIEDVKAEGRNNPNGIYTMNYPYEWTRSDPWQAGHYVRYTYDENGNPILSQTIQTSPYR